jgi:hypothetical protein
LPLARVRCQGSNNKHPFDAALAPFGDVDPVDWSIEAVRAMMVERA